MDSPPTSTPSTSTPIKRKRGEQTELQLDKAVNNVEADSFLFRASGNLDGGYSTDSSGLHYFLTSTSGLDAYIPEVRECRWYFWQYRVKKPFIIINIPEYSQMHPLTVPPECTAYFYVNAEGTVERKQDSDIHTLDNQFYRSVFEQIRPQFPNSIFGLSMPGNGTMHEEVVLDSKMNLVPSILQGFSNARRKKNDHSSTTRSTSSSFTKKIDFGLFKQFVPKDTLRL